MRIIYLHQYFSTRAEATGTRSYEFARRLVRSGHDVQLITTNRATSPSAGTKWTDETHGGIHVHSIGIPYSNRMSNTTRVKAFLKFARHAATRARQLGGDVVFATSTPLTIALPAIFAARLNRIPMVFEVRDLWPEVPIAVGALKNPLVRSAARGLEWLAYHASRHVVALSPGMADGVVRRGYRRDRITVIPSGCDRDLFSVDRSAGDSVRRRLGLDPDRSSIVYTGTFGKINGLHYLVRLAEILRQRAPEVRVLLVGQGMMEECLKHEATERGVLDQNLHIWKPLPKNQMPRLLAAATVATSVFLPLPAMQNNSANKFFDALAAAKPIAINYGGWQAELLERSGAGVVLPAEPEPAVAPLIDFLRSPKRLARASEAADELARTEFDRDFLAKRFESVLSSVVEVESSGDHRRR